jgi:hypothetical protein
VEKKFGEGRVVAFTTTAAPTWNNWARNPSFVVAMLELESYLAAPPSLDANRLVGTPIELEIDPGRYQSEVRLLAPTERAELDDKRDSRDASAQVTTATPQEGGKGMRAAFPEATTSGIHELQLTSTDNKVEVRRLAFNVEADEGDLATVGAEELRVKLEGVAYEYRDAADFRIGSQDLAGTNLSQWMLYLIVGILIGEQALAYSASYHPAKEAAR